MPQPADGPLTGSVDGSFTPTGPIATDGAPTLRIGEATVKFSDSQVREEIVLLPVEIESTRPVGSLSFRIHWGASGFEIGGIDFAEGFRGTATVRETSASAQDIRPDICIEVSPDKPFVGKGKLGILKATARPAEGATRPLLVVDGSARSPDGTRLPLVVQDGKVDLINTDRTFAPVLYTTSSRLWLSGRSTGDRIEVTIDYATDEPAISVGSLEVQFDTSVLALERFQQNPALSRSTGTVSWTKPGETVQDSTGRFSFSLFASDLPASSTLGTLTFRVVGNRVGTSTVVRIGHLLAESSRKPGMWFIPFRKVDATVKISE